MHKTANSNSEVKGVSYQIKKKLNLQAIKGVYFESLYYLLMLYSPI